MRKTAAPLECEPTHYINVDLDIVSSVPLDDLVRAMGEDAFVLYVGRARRKYEAHLELASSHRGMSADETIAGLTRLIQVLPPSQRKVWDSAKVREFNIGIEAGLAPHGFELRLDRRTLDAVSDVRATLVVTVYALDLQEAKARGRRQGKDAEPATSPLGRSNTRLQRTAKKRGRSAASR
jgi:hypothetical protein